MSVAMWKIIFIVGCLLGGSDAIRPLGCNQVEEAKYFEYEDELRKYTHKVITQFNAQSIHRPIAPHSAVRRYQIRSSLQQYLVFLEALRVVLCISTCSAVCVNTPNPDQILFGNDNIQLLDHWRSFVDGMEFLDIESAKARSSSAMSKYVEASQFLRSWEEMFGDALDKLFYGDTSEIDFDEIIHVMVPHVGDQLLDLFLRRQSLFGEYNNSATLSNGVSDGFLPVTDGSTVSWLDPVRHADDLSEVNDTLGVRWRLPSQILSSFFDSLQRLEVAPHVLRMGSSKFAVCGIASPFWKNDARLLQRLDTADSKHPLWRQVLDLVGAENGGIGQSNRFMAIVPNVDSGWHFRCEPGHRLHNPVTCLQEDGWGGHFYQVGLSKPHSLQLSIVAPSRSVNFAVRPESWTNMLKSRIDDIKDVIDFINRGWRQLDSSNPDIFTLHQSIDNCRVLAPLFTAGPINPRMLIIPVNPMIPPGVKVTPYWALWWERVHSVMKLPWVDSEEDLVANTEHYNELSLWLSQCSIDAVQWIVDSLMNKRGFGYSFLNFDGQYAIYLRNDLMDKLGLEKSTKPSQSDWLKGWFCRAESRLFGNLEAASGVAIEQLGDFSLPEDKRIRLLCDLMYRHGVPFEENDALCTKHYEAADEEGLGFDDPANNVLRSVVVSDAAAGITQKVKDIMVREIQEDECLLPNARGWGNDELVSQSFQLTWKMCRAHCHKTKGCEHWTFDSTKLYGATLCWIWVGGAPGELKTYDGWFSGTAPCGQDEAHELAADLAVPRSNLVRYQDDHELHAQSRRWYNQWAAVCLREEPGMSYDLPRGNRGRCLRGFCECFPPWRGRLCELKDPHHVASQAKKPYKAVLQYLTSNSVEDVNDIEHSLKVLWKTYNHRHDYPVVVFHDGLSVAQIERIVSASDNRLWFAFVDDFMEIPDWIEQDTFTTNIMEDVMWSKGYRGMCRFRSGTMFLQPALQEFDYAVTLDTDGYFPADIVNDPIQQMYEGKYIYTWSHILSEIPGAAMHFWSYTLLYMKLNNIHPRGTDLLEAFVDPEYVTWNYRLFMNDIEIVKLDFFRSDVYQDYFRFLDSTGGFWLYRWGDHALRSIAVSMFLPPEQVKLMEIPYAHQGYCRCGERGVYMHCETIEENGQTHFKCLPGDDERIDYSEIIGLPATSEREFPMNSYLMEQL